MYSLWSPDGSKIAFMSGADGDADIYVMNADGTNETKLTDTIENDLYPFWSHVPLLIDVEGDPDLVGTWDLTEITLTGETGSFTVTKEEFDLMVVTFNSDKTHSSIDYLEGVPVNESGTWSTSGNEITFVEDETWTALYTVSGNQMTLTWYDEDEEFPGEEVNFHLIFTKQ